MSSSPRSTTISDNVFRVAAYATRAFVNNYNGMTDAPPFHREAALEGVFQDAVRYLERRTPEVLR